MERILDFIRSEVGADTLMLDFLKELVLFESDSPGWFKERYKEAIDRFIDGWDGRK